MSGPWWNVVTTGIGAVAALGGVMLTQTMTSRRERDRDEQRHRRDQNDQRDEQIRQVLLDVAAYANHLLAVIDRLGDPQRQGPAEGPELVHQDLLTARVRVYAPARLTEVWLRLLTAQAEISPDMEQDLPTHPHLGTTYLPETHRTSLAVRLAGETIMWLVGAILNPRPPTTPGSDPDHVAMVSLEALDYVLDWSDSDYERSIPLVNKAFQLVAPGKAPAELTQWKPPRRPADGADPAKPVPPSGQGEPSPETAR